MKPFAFPADNLIDEISVKLHASTKHEQQEI